MTVQPKPFWESKTLWLNVVAGLVIVLQLALNQQLVPVQYQELALAVLNILLRLKTNQPLTLN